MLYLYYVAYYYYPDTVCELNQKHRWGQIADA
jgi:hypothetical protein